MKKALTILSILIFSIQLLPLTQVGSLLFSSQLTEELPHSFSVEKATDLKFEPAKPEFNLAPGLISSSSQIIYIHFASSLPDNHEGEIQTPPPNVA